MKTPLISDAANYVLQLLQDQLPSTLAFHNVDHTLDVVIGVREIGFYSGMNVEQMEDLEIAAWFHDTGYLLKYIGHEDESVRIAESFLIGKGISAKRRMQIIECINVTRFPQKPTTILEEIICDADFYHFSIRNYPVIAQRLKIEWECHLHKSYLDKDWKKINCDMLSTHKYFTEYGRNVLQGLKEKNLAKIKCYSL
ncbi:MAG: hypothetical protein JWQ25_2291 [Daejeonella sp.]|nr:hypothetical protein [Daejeonella sp.]